MDVPIVPSVSGVPNREIVGSTVPQMVEACLEAQESATAMGLTKDQIQEWITEETNTGWHISDQAERRRAKKSIMKAINHLLKRGRLCQHVCYIRIATGRMKKMTTYTALDQEV